MTGRSDMRRAYTMIWARLKAKILELLRTGPGDSGEALDEQTRVEMESAFGYDLRDVRIHKTEQAGKLARRLRADAFNIGINLGAEAGQEVPHLHIHVLPRFSEQESEGQGVSSVVQPR